MSSLKVRWRGAVYEIATCLTPERALLAAAPWPDGVLELERLLEPNRPNQSPAFTEAERKGLVKMALRALGELEPRKPALPGSGKPRTVAVPATFGTKGKRTIPARLVRRRIDHAFVTALLQQQKPAPAPREGFALKPAVSS